jgi:hypothetical protein
MRTALIVLALLPIPICPAYAQPETWTCYFNAPVIAPQVITFDIKKGMLFDDNVHMRKDGIAERSPIVPNVKGVDNGPGIGVLYDGTSEAIFIYDDGRAWFDGISGHCRKWKTYKIPR